MDTPCQPRRKLKRVLKKVDKLNSSSQKLSQKKLRVAINTSLNSTNSLRSLKNNNYSLALRLENVREELKMVKDDKNDLLEENYALKEKVNSLEQMLVEEVEQRKNRVEMEAIRRVINSLNTHMSNFCVDLEQLAQICFPRALSLENRRSSESRSAGDSGDCGIQPSPMPICMDDSDRTVTDDRSSASFEQQYTSSVNKMKDIERRVQMENELPRRIRSFSCLEEEDACVDLTAVELNVIPDNTLLDDTLSEVASIVQAPLHSGISHELENEQLGIGNEKKSAPLAKSRKKKHLPKQPNDVGHKDLHIANEFALNAAHLNIIERHKEKDSGTMADESVERTIHAPTDMELTMPVDETFLAVTNSHEHFETFRESLSTIKPRRLTRVLTEDPDDQSSSQSSDELVPDAVTMKKLKPGQFKFSVGRKTLEGSRKEVVDVPRARSKSKKRIAELVEQLPQEEPKSIFDFHEKTPKFSAENAEKGVSVYTLANESAPSPCAPLKKDKVTRRTGESVRIPSASNHTDSLSSSDYSDPLNDSPRNTLSTKTSRLSRSRSRRVNKNTKRSSFVADNLLSDNETVEQDTHRDLTLIGGVTYSEPLKDSPSNESKKASRNTRSRSRRRTKPPLLDISNEYFSDFESLNMGVEYSEPLKDSSVSESNKNSKISRSRSRRRTKTLLDVNREFCSVAEVTGQDEKDNCRLLQDKTTPEVFDESCDKTPKKLSKISRSRSQRATKKANNSSEETEDKSCDENIELLLTFDGEDSNEVLNKMACSEVNPDGSRQQSQNVSESTAETAIIPSEFDNDKQLTSDQGERKLPSLLGEGSTYSVPLKDTPVKTPRVSKKSRNQTERLTRSTGRSKSNKSGGTDNNIISSGDSNSCLETEKEHNVRNPDESKISSLLGEGTAYSVSFKDSPVKTPTKLNKRSRSQMARVARSTGRSLKKSCSETDQPNDGCSILSTDISRRLEEQALESTDESNKINLLDKDLGVADVHAYFESASNELGGQDERLKFPLDREIPTVNTRRKKSSRSRKERTEETDSVLHSHPETHQEGVLYNGPEVHLKSHTAEESQSLAESKTIKEKKSRSKKVKNQATHSKDNCDSGGLVSIDLVVAISNNDTEDKETNSSTTNHEDERIELDNNHIEIIDNTENVDTCSETCTLKCETVEGNGMSIADIDVEKVPSSRSHRATKRKREIKDLFEYENKCEDKPVAKNKSSGDAESATSGPQDDESQVSIQGEEDHLLSGSLKVTAGKKKSRSHSAKSHGQEMSPLKVVGYQTNSSRQLSASPAHSKSSEQESSDFQPGRQRRTKLAVSYAEPSLSKKLRRGDPFTAVLGRVKIFKSPKLQGKKKLNRSVLESLQNLDVSTATILE